jgi:putative transposase
MKRGRFSEEQIVGILKEHEAGRKIVELAREHGVSEATLYGWKSKYGGMEVGEAQRLRGLEEENRRLKQLVADLSLDKEAHRDGRHPRGGVGGRSGGKGCSSRVLSLAFRECADTSARSSDLGTVQ